ncbi:MAG: O-antigen ligase family protein [Pseudomonadota bacterium]
MEWRIYSVLLAAAFAFAAVSYAWSPWEGRLLEFNPSDGKYAVKSSVIRLFLVAAAGAVVFAMARASDIASARRLSRYAPWAVAAMVGLLTITALFEAFLLDLFSPLSSSPGELVQNIGRNAMMTAAAAPILASHLASAERVGPLGAYVVAAVVAASAVYLGFYAAALAIFAAFAGAGVVRIWPAHGFRILGWCSAALVFSAPVLVLLFLSDAGGAADANSTETASMMWRMDAWRLTVGLIAEKPVFGWGADASRTVDVVYTAGAFKGELIVGGHPHNMPLQVWLELGAVGAALLSAALIALGGRLPEPRSIGMPAAQAAAGVWGACAVACGVSFGLWNAGWWAFVAVIVCCLVLIAMRKDEFEA